VSVSTELDEVSADRWGLKEAQSNRAGRRTGIPPRRDGGPPGMTVKASIRSGGCCINLAPAREPFGVFPWESCRRSTGADGGRGDPA
jgi:hypothetical protein